MLSLVANSDQNVCLYVSLADKYSLRQGIVIVGLFHGDSVHWFVESIDLTVNTNQEKSHFGLLMRCIEYMIDEFINSVQICQLKWLWKLQHFEVTRTKSIQHIT